MKTHLYKSKMQIKKSECPVNLINVGASQVALMVKNQSANAEDAEMMVQLLGGEDTLE